VYANEIAFLQQGAVGAFYTNNNNGKEYNKTFFVAPAIIGSYVSLISKEKKQSATAGLKRLYNLANEVPRTKALI
jgi:hypothetical protein